MSVVYLVFPTFSDRSTDPCHRLTETFEGLGVGTRLAYMQLPPAYNWVPVVGAMLYGITTPIGTLRLLISCADRMFLIKYWWHIGIAVGLGVRTTYNPDSTTASIVSGILDAFSSGILIYTGLVEVSILFFACMITKISLIGPMYSSSRTSSCSTVR